MKKIFLLILVSVSSTMLVAQNSKWSQTEIIIQSRFFQQPDNFTMNYDLGIGTRLNYHFTPKLSISLGAFMNNSQYTKDNISEDETFYIDFFKGSEVHYFAIETVNQWCLETPLSIQFQFATVGKNQFSLLTGAASQLNLSNQFTGFRFNEAATVTNNFTNNENYLLNDVLLNVGFSILRPIDESRNILLEFGYEHSIEGETSGIFIRTGIDF